MLVTGGGGSIGSELCRQIAFLKPKCLVIYELNEFSLYKIDLDLSENYSDLRKYAYLGNVLDRNHLARVIQQHQIQTIYHTAAYFDYGGRYSYGNQPFICRLNLELLQSLLAMVVSLLELDLALANYDQHYNFYYQK